MEGSCDHNSLILQKTISKERGSEHKNARSLKKQVLKTVLETLLLNPQRERERERERTQEN
jgi:hypothetical protein